MDAVAQFARNVAEARRRAGLTQEDVSGESGVHPTEVSRIENGSGTPASQPCSGWRRLSTSGPENCSTG